jgi:hypothetical protein
LAVTVRHTDQSSRFSIASHYLLYKEAKACSLGRLRLQATGSNSRLEQGKVTFRLVCIRLRVLRQGDVELIGRSHTPCA